MTRRNTRSSALRTLAALGAAACAVSLLAACGGSKKAPVSSTARSSSAAPTTSTPAPPPPPPPPVNALTGVGAPPTTSVIAVKIDDTEPGRPQLGIDQADVVYIEQAEGGLSRLLAVFSTNLPVVGYVRSTRPSDPELLLQYGKITLAASGGGGDALPLLDQSGLNPWINDRSAPFYARVNRRQSDYINLSLDLAQVAGQAKTPAAVSTGFTFAPAVTSIAPSGPGAVFDTAVGSTPVKFAWNASIARYVRYIDGTAQVAADGAPVAAANVIVQNCVIEPHYGDVDVNGNPSQFTHTVGQGTMTLFRNGQAYAGTWVRPDVASGTTWRDAAGNPLPLSPGPTWVVLAANGAPLTAS